MISEHYKTDKILSVKYRGVRGILNDKMATYLFQYSSTGFEIKFDNLS